MREEEKMFSKSLLLKKVLIIIFIPAIMGSLFWAIFFSNECRYWANMFFNQAEEHQIIIYEPDSLPLPDNTISWNRFSYLGEVYLTKTSIEEITNFYENLLETESFSVSVEKNLYNNNHDKTLILFTYQGYNIKIEISKNSDGKKRNYLDIEVI